MLPLLLRLVIAFVGISAIIVVLQNPQIFPGAVSSLFKSKIRDISSLPKNVESRFIYTSDQKRIELWKLAQIDSSHTAIIFHGNGGDIENFFPYQEFFHELGITTYAFDYRGYGKSSGWPTETGLYLDSEAVIKHVLKSENTSPDKLIIVGISIGTGPAAYIASKYSVGTLLLYTPFTSLKAAVKSQIPFGFLAPFLIYKFPVADYVKTLKETCLIVINGKKDNVIPYEQGENVFKLHPDNQKSFLFTSPNAGHNNILDHSKKEVKEFLLKCLN